MTEACNNAVIGKLPSSFPFCIFSTAVLIFSSFLESGRGGRTYFVSMKMETKLARLPSVERENRLVSICLLVIETYEVSFFNCIFFCFVAQNRQAVYPIKLCQQCGSGTVGGPMKPLVSLTFINDGQLSLYFYCI